MQMKDETKLSTKKQQVERRNSSNATSTGKIMRMEGVLIVSLTMIKSLAGASTHTYMCSEDQCCGALTHETR